MSFDHFSYHNYLYASIVTTSNSSYSTKIPSFFRLYKYPFCTESLSKSFEPVALIINGFVILLLLTSIMSPILVITVVFTILCPFIEIAFAPLPFSSFTRVKRS